MLERLHLVRHGEVSNPGALVYAALPGFRLSRLGRAQAGQAARHLASSRTGLVVSSPLDRAVATAEPIAARLAVPLRVDDRLIEWRLADRWAGIAWADLPERFPGEVEAYLATPADLPFSSESIQEVARRMTEVVADLDREDLAEAVVVSHQDPVQALRFALTGRDLALLGYDRPGHATVVTLQRARTGWTEEAIWSPSVTSPTFPPIADGDGT